MYVVCKSECYELFQFLMPSSPDGLNMRALVEGCTVLSAIPRVYVCLLIICMHKSQFPHANYPLCVSSCICISDLHEDALCLEKNPVHASNMELCKFA